MALESDSEAALPERQPGRVADGNVRGPRRQLHHATDRRAVLRQPRRPHRPAEDPAAVDHHDDDPRWRAAYWFGSGIAIVVLALRTMVRETPQLEKLEAKHELVKMPVVQAIRDNPRAILVAIALAGFVGIVNYVVYSPTYAQIEGGIENWQALLFMMLTAAAFSVLAPVAGALSDRVERRPVLTVSAVVLIAPVTTVTGTFASATGELAPTRERCSGLSVGYSFGNAFLGGTAALVAQSLVTLTGSSLAPTWYVLLASAVIIPVVWHMKETERVPTAELGVRPVAA